MWSYSGDPGASNLDALRFLIGDTVEASAVFSDEELDWLLSQNSNIYYAAATAAESAWASYASAESGGSGTSGTVKTRTVGALSLTYGILEDKDRAEQFKAMAKRFRLQAAIGGGWRPYSGGISKSDKETNEQDSDWDKPAFTRGMLDYPGADRKPREFLSGDGST